MQTAFNTDDNIQSCESLPLIRNFIGKKRGLEIVEQSSILEPSFRIAYPPFAYWSSIQDAVCTDR